MFTLVLDDREYYMQWMHCECSSYPIALGFSIGRCGKCGIKPEGSYDTRTESEMVRLAVYEKY